MADPTINTKPIEDAFERMARSIRNQEQASYKLSEAFDKLGEKAVKSLEDKVKNLAKQTGLLTDDQLKLIKNTQNLSDAVAQKEKDLEKQLEKSTEALKEYTAAMKAAEKLAFVNDIALAKATAEAKYKEIKDGIEVSKNALDAFKSQTDSLISNAEALNIFTQHVDKVTNSIKGWAAENLTTRKSFELLKQSATQAIDELNKATAVGLQNSFAAIGWEAMKLKMSFDEFSDVIAKNRDIVRQLGGGAIGINEFSKRIQESSKTLAYMGKDGTAATARFFGTLKSMGETVGSKTFDTAMKKTQIHFTEFSKLYGDNAEQFANLLESQMEGTSIQSKLNGLGETAKLQLQEEIIKRTQNLKNLGLSNEQILEFNNKLENLYDPHKNEQGEAVTQGELGADYFEQLAAAMPENKALAAAVPALQALARMRGQGATATQINKRASDLHEELLIVGQARASQVNKQGAAFEAGEGGAAFTNFVPNAFNEMAGKILDPFLKVADIAANKASTKGNVTPGQEATGVKDAEKERLGEVDLFTKGMKLARDAQQEYTAIMKGSIAIGLLGLAAAVGTAAFSLYKFKTALDLASKGLGLLGGGTPDLSGSDKGGKGKWSKIGKYGGTALAIGMAGYEGYNTYEDYNAGKISEKDRNKGYGKTGGALAGGLAGAEAGALMGAWGGPWGMAAGGLIGGGVGAYYGAKGGEYAGDFGSNSTKINPTPDTDAADAASAVAAAAAYQTQSKIPDEKSDNVVEELKLHRTILQQIAQNTVSFKAGTNPDLLRRAPTVAVRAIGGNN